MNAYSFEATLAHEAAERRHEASTEARADAAEQRRTDAYTQAFAQLEEEFMVAALLSPLQRIATPAWGEKQASSRLIDVVNDSMAGIDSDDRWVELVGILANSNDGLKWLEKRAKEHAKFHADDAAEAA